MQTHNLVKLPFLRFLHTTSKVKMYKKQQVLHTFIICYKLSKYVNFSPSEKKKEENQPFGL